MTILVTTATGTVGRHLVTLLAERPDVRYVTRSRDSAVRLRARVRGEVAVADLSSAEDRETVLDGAKRVFLAYPFCEEQVDVEVAIGQIALAAGAERIVKIGARRFPSWLPTDLVTGAHEVITDRLRPLLGTAILSELRPDRFMQNFLASVDALRAGVLEDQAVGSRLGYVDARDIAEVVAQELCGEEPAGGAIEISGPELLSTVDIVDTIINMLGIEVRLVDVIPDESWRNGLIAAGIPSYVATGLAGLYRNYRSEGSAALGDKVRRILGRSPRSLETFLRNNVAPLLAADGDVRNP